MTVLDGNITVLSRINGRKRPSLRPDLPISPKDVCFSGFNDVDQELTVLSRNDSFRPVLL